MRPAVSPNWFPHLDARAASQRVGGGRAEERRPCGSRSLKDAVGGGGGRGKRRGLHWLQGEEKRNSEDAMSEGTEEGGLYGVMEPKRREENGSQAMWRRDSAGRTCVLPFPKVVCGRGLGTVLAPLPFRTSATDPSAGQVDRHR